MFDMDTLWLIFCLMVMMVPHWVIGIFMERSAYWRSQAPLRYFFLGMEARWLDNLAYAGVGALCTCTGYVAAIMYLLTGYKGLYVDKVEAIILVCVLGIVGGVLSRLLHFCEQRRTEVSSHIRPRPGLPSNPANLSSWITGCTLHPCPAGVCHSDGRFRYIWCRNEAGPTMGVFITVASVAVFSICLVRHRAGLQRFCSAARVARPGRQAIAANYFPQTSAEAAVAELLAMFLTLQSIERTRPTRQYATSSFGLTVAAIAGV